MKNVLFASTALAAMAIGGAASAQGVTLFGDARLGLGYNINNDGSVSNDDDDSDLKAVSRVRFGVNMAGETDSGISFGATIRADNASGGQGGSLGQTAGNVFISGDWGTLTFGDTAGADENWVGDIPGNLSLTGLGDLQETFFISNGGSFGTDVANNFASNPNARPTVRYDFDIAGFGLSLSSNKELTDVGVGAGYAGEFANGSWNVGVGYYNYKSFRTTDGVETAQVCTEDDSDLLTVDCASAAADEVFVVTGADISRTVPKGEQWSASAVGNYGNWGLGLVWTQAESKNSSSVDGAKFSTLGIGGTFGWEDLTVGAYYVTFLDATEGLQAFDGEDTYGLTAAYDLGGGAQVATGIATTFGRGSDINPNRGSRSGDTVADFGIKMSF